MRMVAATAEFLDRSMKTAEDTMSRLTRRNLMMMPPVTVDPKLDEFHAHVAMHLVDLRHPMGRRRSFPSHSAPRLLGGVPSGGGRGAPQRS